MIGPVSGTGRAMMASLQQAMAKGMPPDQAIQYVKTMAMQGVAPLADLYAMMNQFQRLKQQKVTAPQTPPTIKDELNMQEQQAAAMGQGLGAVNAGTMEEPQFAGGGIVAFSRGGNEGLEDIDFTKMTTEQLQTLASGEDRELASAAYDEYLRRTGYVDPSEYIDKYVEAVKAGIPQGGIFKFDSRKFPSYMYDEEGKVRRGEITAGIGGLKEVPSSRTMVRQLSPETPERFTETQARFAETLATPTAPVATQSAVPTTAETSPMNFDAMASRARLGVPQDAGFGAVSTGAGAGARTGAETGAGTGTRSGTGAGRTSTGRTSADPLDKLREEFGGSEEEYVRSGLSKQEELERRLGVGQYGEARKAREAQLAELDKRTEKQIKEDRRLDQAEFFFNIAAAASQPGSTFISSLAKAGPGFAKASRATTERLRELQSRAQEARIKLLEADELRKEGYAKEAQKRFEEGRQDLIKYGFEIYKSDKNIQGQLDVARTYAGRADNKLAITGLRGNQRLQELAVRGAQKRVQDARKALGNPMVQLMPEDRAKAEAELAAAETELAQLQSMGAVESAGVPGGTYTGPYSTSGWER